MSRTDHSQTDHSRTNNNHVKVSCLKPNHAKSCQISLVFNVNVKSQMLKSIREKKRHKKNGFNQPCDETDI